jgi:hypothetical protein
MEKGGEYSSADSHDEGLGVEKCGSDGLGREWTYFGPSRRFARCGSVDGYSSIHPLLRLVGIVN